MFKWIRNSRQLAEQNFYQLAEQNFYQLAEQNFTNLQNRILPTCRTKSCQLADFVLDKKVF